MTAIQTRYEFDIRAASTLILGGGGGLGRTFEWVVPTLLRVCRPGLGQGQGYAMAPTASSDATVTPIIRRNCRRISSGV